MGDTPGQCEWLCHRTGRNDGWGGSHRWSQAVIAAGGIVVAGRVSGSELLVIRGLLAEGLSIREVEVRTGRSNSTASRVLIKFGRMKPCERKRPRSHLTLEDRCRIFGGIERGDSDREIGADISRPGCTVSREIGRNGGRDVYSPHAADLAAWDRARRPKPLKLANRELLSEVTGYLADDFSPEQISFELKTRFCNDSDMQVSHETIYQSLFVQAKSTLKRDLCEHLRTKRTARKPRGSAKQKAKIKDMVNISQRPPTANDRSIPGHWEGDLIIGANNHSAVLTLVERYTRFAMVGKLANGYSTDEVVKCLKRMIRRLPTQLRISITWDQGIEMAGHAQFSIDEKIAVYFCDPKSPWQRGTNENTNGLLRQYMPKGTDLSVHRQADLDSYARKLNKRPRQTLGGMKPAIAFQQLIDKNAALTA